jgi:hypothetical protein
MKTLLMLLNMRGRRQRRKKSACTNRLMRVNVYDDVVLWNRAIDPDVDRLAFIRVQYSLAVMDVAPMCYRHPGNCEMPQSSKPRTLRSNQCCCSPILEIRAE